MRRHSERSLANRVGLLITLGSLGFASASLAEVYRWVDDDGVVHFSDIPPDSAVERVAVRSEPTDRAEIDLQAEQAARIARERADRQQQEAEAADAEAQIRTEIQRQSEQNCGTARQRLESYLNSHRLYRPMPDGEREYLTDEELDAARAEARQAVEEWCGTSS